MALRLAPLRPLLGLGPPRPLVSLVRLVGTIGALGPFQSGLTLAGIEKTLVRAFAPKRLAAVALVINSPGGSPVQAALIHDRIRALAAEKSKPIFAFVEDVGASGGYWLACAGDEIYANRSSIVGSIGVITASFGFHDAISRVGIERRLYTEGDRKVLLDPFSPENLDGVERLKRIQKEIHAAFVEHVRARRGDRLRGSDEDLFSGDVFTGRRALELGLIDGLGDVRGVMRARFGEKVRFYQPAQPRLRLVRRLRFGTGGATGGTMPSTPSDWFSGLFAAVEARALWARFGL